MANEKVYVGEDGAKELYRKIKALIPGAVTVVDEVSLQSMDAVTSHAVALAIGNLTGFQTASGTGDDKHPNVAEPNTRTIYLVKIPDSPGEDKYKEWIWVVPSQGEGNWECIGSTTMVENAWKQWSEDHGSTSSNDISDKSIYIGRNNTINAHSAVAIGKLNTISNSSGYGTHIYGNNNTVSDGHDSIVVGHDNTSSASLQVEIFGQKNSVDQTKTGTQYSAILGFNNTANDFDRSVMLGVAAKATEVLYSTVIGNGAELYNCTYGTVVGGANIVKNGSYNSVFGSGNQVNVENTRGYKVSTIGNNLTISGTETHVMGSHSTVTGDRIHAIVTNSTINASNSNVIGSQISMYADSSGNVGYNNYVFGAMDGVYGGSQNVIVGCTSSIKDKRSNTVIVGENSTVENKSGDVTSYSNTNIISIGYANNAKSAANAYQIGRDNSVTDNNLASINTYPYQTAINLGVHNTITSEGVNLGKDNTAYGFGVTLGQGNSAKYASYAFGNRMEATSGSIAIGGNDGGYTNSINVLFYVDGNTATLAEKVKKHDTYTYRSYVVPVKNESGKYVWQSLNTYEQYVIFSNIELHKHILILLGGLNFDSTVKYGYFDSNEEFVATSSSDSRAKPYYHFLQAYDRQGHSYDVSSFYCSLNNGSPVQTGAGYFYAGQSIPAVGWVYDQAGYEDAIAHFYDGGLTPVNYLYVNDSDASIATDNSYFVTEFDVYGYYDSDKFIPYNETNKNDGHEFEWVTVSADKIELRNIVDPATAGVEPETPIADGASILLGKSGHVSGNSIGIVGSETQLAATFEMADSLYESETSYKTYTINQNSGSYSYSSYSKSFIKASNPSTSNYSYTVGSKRSYIDGISFGIVLNDNYSTKSTTITGNSMGIGSGLDVGGNSYSIGQNNFARNNSFVLGKENTDVWNKSVVTGFNNASIYENAVVYGCNNTRIGRQQSQSESPMGSSVVIGYSSQQVWGSSLAIGFANACVTDNSVSVGNGCSYIDDASVGIGQGNRYITSSSVAIGNANTYVSNSAFVFGSMNSNILNASIAIGSFHTNIGEASIAIGLRNSVNSGSVALGEGLSAKNTSFVVGRGATGDGASIVLGNGNTGINAAFIMGIGNRGNYYGDNAIHTNAVILGLGNSVYNHRTAVPGISDNGVCSFVAGSYITVYGHNGIGIGSGHIIGNSSKWAQDTTTGSIELDNDGFMTAIGYRCEALRNYDFAFGYQSKAKGGENIAFQHSTAEGYRNIAAIDSNVNGIANIGLLESYLGSSASNTANKRAHNILAKSRVQCNDTPFYDNIVIGSTMTAPTTAGDNYPTSANIIIDNSAITGKAYTIQHNILFNQSSITSTKSTTGFDSSTIFDNIAFNESTLEYRDLDSAWSGSQQPLGHNISFGSYMGNTYGCVSIADRRVNDASLFNSLRVFNFGDNSISCTGESYCFGQSNTISWASRAFVCGHQNTFNGRATSLGDSNNVIRHLTVFGNLNETSISDGSKIDRVFINGHKNKVSTNIFDARIFGNENQLGWQFSEDTSTHETLTFAELKARQVQHPTVFITADEPVFVMGISGRVYSSQPGKAPIQNNEVYIYCKGSVRYLYSSDYSGQTVVSISGDDFIRGTISKTLTDWGYYRVTSAPTIQYSINELGRLWSSGAKVMKYPDGTIYSVIDGTEYHCNARDTIFGSNNTIQPAVNDTTIFGSDNLVSNPLQYPISNSFIQGNNNVVTNGSNIFVAGNGCVGNGHGAVAIGCQVKANHWQTVIGKYNEWVPGPDRLTPGEDDSDAALFVIGNGYSEIDGPEWQNEAYIHRSNAMEVYADGTVKAKKFVSDEPDFELVEGNGIQLETNVSAETITISAKQPLPPTPTTPGSYALQCVVDTNGTPTLSWVSIGVSNV